MRILLATAALFLLSCASGRAPEETAPREHLGFVFPERIAESTLRDFHAYENPALGVIANYQLVDRSRVLLSVYAFPPVVLEDGSRPPIEKHAELELAGLVNHYLGARLIPWPQEIAYSPRSGNQTYRAALEIDHPEIGHVYSLLLLQERGEARLKIRISYEPSDSRAALSIRRFLDEIL